MAKYIFNDNTKLLFVKGNYILTQNGNEKQKILLDDDFYNTLKLVQQKYYIFSNESKIFTNEQLRFLYKNKIIKEVSKISEKYLNTKYEKYQFYLENIYKDAAQIDYIENNHNKKILFVGAGGICTAMIDHLIAVGFCNYGIIDYDKVEITNFNRQFKYNKKDIGYSKVERLKANLNQQYSGLSITIFNKKITSYDDLKKIVNQYDPDFIICAADMPILLIQKYVVEVCLSTNIPCIFGSVGQKVGAIGPLLYKKSNFNKYLKKINFALQSLNSTTVCKGSFSITNSFVSNYMAKDIILYSMNKKNCVLSLNKEYEIDFDRNLIYEKAKY